MAAEWFYQAKGQHLGPVEPAELRRLADRGAVLPNTLVRKGTAGAWVPAEKIQGLFGRGGSPAAMVGQDAGKLVSRDGINMISNAEIQK